MIGEINERDADNMSKALDIIKRDQEIKDKLYGKNLEIIEKRIAEESRQNQIRSNQNEFSKIDAAREQKLIAMSAPLVREMATPLRRSANTLEIFQEQSHSKDNFLYLDKKMAEEIIVSKVDESITLLLGDIIQYNKETGWGKIRTNSQPIPFSVPADYKNALQDRLLQAMGTDKVYVQTYITRDKAGDPIRLIIVGILPTPTK